MLIDLPRLKGVKYLEPGTAIYPADLDAWEKMSGIHVGAGDAVLIRTGRWARRAEKGPWAASETMAGLNASRTVAQAARCRGVRQRRSRRRSRRV